MTSASQHPCFSASTWRPRSESIVEEDVNQEMKPVVHEDVPGRELATTTSGSSMPPSTAEDIMARKDSRSSTTRHGTHPKNFRKPLTCFYWWSGHCNKSDEECWYAHYDTGLVADAPVSLESRTVAGRKAEARISVLSAQEEQIRVRERIVERREKKAEARDTQIMRRENDCTKREEEVRSLEKRLAEQELDLQRQLHDLRRWKHSRADLDATKTQALKIIESMGMHLGASKALLQQHRCDLTAGKAEDQPITTVDLASRSTKVLATIDASTDLLDSVNGKLSQLEQNIRDHAVHHIHANI